MVNTPEKGVTETVLMREWLILVRSVAETVELGGAGDHAIGNYHQRCSRKLCVLSYSRPVRNGVMKGVSLYVDRKKGLR